jgi:transposase
MEYFAAIDVSLELSSVCVVDGTGRIVREAKVASEPDALVRYLRGSGLVLTRVGLEAGPLSQWLHAGLTEAGFEAVLLETRHVKAALGAMTMKTDRNDARGMAQMIRMGWFRPVHAKTVPAQEIRALLVARKQLQARLNDLELCLRGICAASASSSATSPRGGSRRASANSWPGRGRSRASLNPCFAPVRPCVPSTRPCTARCCGSCGWMRTAGG